ncbi:MAG: PAS domain S-box protein [Armatimonadetes bacterium]|nr:PAS domain S-box protein [Armatimonadota bacterium]
MVIVFIQVVAIILQLAAAILALRLVPVTGRRLAWVLISSALALIVVRRGIALIRLISTDLSAMPNFAGRMLESMVLLVISILFVAGITLIRTVFLSVKQAEQEARTARDELESRVHERTAELEQTNQALLAEVDERKQVEKALKESEARWRGFLQSAPDGIVIVDRDARIAVVNAKAEELFGYSQQELIGKTVETLVPERYRDVHVKHRSGYTDAPRSRPMGVGLELYGRRKDGSEFPVEISLSPLQTEQGLLVTAIIRDITERKRIQEALQQSEQKYKTLVENLPQRIFLKDRNSVYISCNDNYARDLNIPPDQIAGKTDYDFFPKELADKYRGDDKRIMAEGKTEDIEEAYIQDGREYIVHTVKTPIKDESGSITGVLGIFWDITEQKRSEEQIKRLNEDLRHRAAELEAANKELEAFSYSVSHDLRAPLRSVDGFSQALLEDYADKLDEQGKDYLGRVRSAAKRMAQLIDDLLRLSRVTRAEMHREEVDLSAMARDAAESLKQSQPEREVEFDIAPDLTAYADPQLLRIVLDNLLGNAWKFTGKHKRAYIMFSSVQQEGKQVYFVRDDGAGFDMAYIDKLFVPFQRLHSMEEFPGSGIGLAIVQRIIRRHGGSVWAEGAVEHGATFYFTLS